MTTNTLAKHYGTFDAAERLSLLIAAGARGDDVEHARLADSAPRVTWTVPHTFGRALAFLAVFGHHRMELLDLAGLFFKASAVADDAADEHAKRLWPVVRLYGYLIAAHAEGWARFCEEERLDSALCESVSPGTETLKHATREAAEVAFAEGEAREYLHAANPDFTGNVITADGVANGFRDAFRFLLQKWE